MENRGKQTKGSIKEEIEEDWCFECKDGGEVQICDYKQCLKVYHLGCVRKEESFLDNESNWKCPWHSCVECKKSSYFHCYTCKYALCRSCIPHEDFIQVRRTNGFCYECLELVLLIEEGKDCDSYKNPVDFGDLDTYEGLFKKYYEVIKHKEVIQVKDIYAAQERDKAKKHVSTEPERKWRKTHEKFAMVPNAGSERQESAMTPNVESERRGSATIPKMKLERGNSSTIPNAERRKIEFAGWCSKPLIEFLASIGKSTTEKLCPNKVAAIVIDYIVEKKLLHDELRNVVLCDERLQSLLDKTTFTVHRLDDFLEAHFSTNVDESEEEDGRQKELDSPSMANSPNTNDDSLQSLQRRIQELEAENARLSICLRNCVCQKSGSSDKPRVSDCGPRQTAQSDMVKKVREKKIEKKIEKGPSELAAIVVDNIKLVHLWKTVLEELLKEPESFEEKVTGCFVRIKSGPSYSFPRNRCHIRQIKGVKTVSVGENQTETALLLSAMPAETLISSIMNGNLLEEECVELKEKIQAGIFEWPTVDELQRKAELLHKDITNNFYQFSLKMVFKLSNVLFRLIAKELYGLPGYIDQANTKGLKYMKLELIQRRKMLQNPLEVTRLLETLRIRLSLDLILKMQEMTQKLMIKLPNPSIDVSPLLLLIDGRKKELQGQLMQMTVMTPLSFNTELSYLNKEDRLLRWLLVQHRDVKFGLDFFNEDDVKSELRSFGSNPYEAESVDEDDDDIVGNVLHINL